MPELQFQITSASIERFAAQPTIKFGLRIGNITQAVVRNVILQCQIRIEAQRRSYVAAEQLSLKELFGPPKDWARSLRSLLWTHVNLVAPLTGSESVVKLPVPCSYDFNLAIAKYLYGIESGEVPLLFLFSGTVLYENPQGAVLLDQIPWNKEASFQLSINIWKDLMNHYYPDATWLQLSRSVFDRVDNYKRERGFLSWEDAIESLLEVNSGEIV